MASEQPGPIMCRCTPGREHVWEPGEWCPPVWPKPRPAAPAEPPAADSPTPGTVDPVTGHAWNGLRWIAQDQSAAPSPVGTTEPPAGKCDQCTLSVPHYHAKPMTGPAFSAPPEPPVEVLVDVDHEPYANAYEWEPPAETQQGGGLCDDRGPRIGSEGTPRCRRPLGHDGPHRPAEEDGWGMAMPWGNLPTADTPAEAQQDDVIPILADLLRFTYSVQLDSYPSRAARKESERVADAFRVRIGRHAREHREARRAALAARPSADTETLRARIEKLAKQYQRLSEELHLVPAADAFADAALDLRRALDAR